MSGEGDASPPDQTAHRRIARAVAGELARRPLVEAVLLSGSVARGEHRSGSDVDLLVIGEDEEIPFSRMVDGILVECISHSARSWRDRFERDGTSWLYAVLDGEVLEDSEGVAAELRTAARTAYTEYRTPPELGRRIATMIHHGHAKLERASEGPPAVRGYWASICTETMLDALYAVHDAPLPAGSRRLEHLGDIGLSDAELALVDRLLDGSTEERFAALLRLIETVAPRLGPPDVG